MSAAILRYLRRKAQPVPAATIITAVKLTHEQAYSHLVALENSGRLRVVVDASARRKCSGVRGWEFVR